MNTVILVAALNSGLRNGIGHATLVSHESALDESVSAKLAYCSGIVRDSEQEVTWGEQFVGLRSSSTQKTSGRDAPEVFLMWNVAVSELTGEQKRRIVEWLRQLSDDRADLVDECKSAIASRTMMISQSLHAWAATHGNTFPVFGSLPGSDPVEVKAELRPRRANVRQGTKQGRLVAGALALFIMLGLVAWQFSRPQHKEGDNDTSMQPVKTDRPEQGNVQHQKPKVLGFQKWIADVKKLDAEASSQAIPYSDAAVEFLGLCKELSHMTIAPQEKQKAHDKVKAVASSLQHAVIVGGEKLLDDELKTLAKDGAAFENYRSLRETIKASSESLKNILEINIYVPDAQISDMSGQLERSFFESLFRVVADHCAVFRREKRREPSDREVAHSIQWIQDAKRSDFANQVKESSVGSKVAAVLEAFQCLDRDVRLDLIIESGDAPLDARSLSIEFVDSSGNRIRMQTSEVKRHSGGRAIGDVIESIATVDVSEWQLWRTVEIRVTAPSVNIPVTINGGVINTYCWGGDDVEVIYSRPHRLDNRTAIGRKRFVQVSIKPQDQTIRSCISSVEKVLSELEK